LFETLQAKHFAIEQRVVASRRFGRPMPIFSIVAGYDGSAALGAMAIVLATIALASASRALQRGGLHILGKRHAHLNVSMSGD
jgi:hypothetical protein